MSKLLIAVLALSLVSCGKIDPEARAKEAESRQQNALNRDYQILKLFTKDGCTVYSFRDRSYTHYFTNCKGSTSTTQDCGKSCINEEEISTTE